MGGFRYDVNGFLKIKVPRVVYSPLLRLDAFSTCNAFVTTTSGRPILTVLVDNGSPDSKT